jgi:hypothetical protein
MSMSLKFWLSICTGSPDLASGMGVTSGRLAVPHPAAVSRNPISQ